MFCKNCGKELSENAQMCPQCGEPTVVARATFVNPNIPDDASDREWLTTLLLCIFVGGFGVHNFYAGKTTIGIIQLLTLGCCGVWTLVDLIMILTKGFRDVDGRLIVR